MKLRVKILEIESGGKPIVYLNQKDADEINVSPSERIQLLHNGMINAIVYISSKTVNPGFIGISEDVKTELSLEDDFVIDVDIAPFPKSLKFIRSKLAGKRLHGSEILEIVKDVVDGNLNENEISAFLTALHLQKPDLAEITSLSYSMVKTGKTLNIGKDKIFDKHSIGGLPGDKTTLLVVPIVASQGLTIPKTSSRAITSTAGTADRAEVLMSVALKMDKMLDVIKQCNGCIVWGGALDLAPADDIFVQNEFSLHIDPMLLPSIMSKKKAVGATHLVMDIPVGRGSKMKTIVDGDILANELIELGNRLDIQTHCLITRGEQPLGNAIGPALEAKEALEVLMNKKKIPELRKKACHIAGTLFEISGINNGYELAQQILNSGKAEEKLRQIISYQGGNPDIKPEDIEIGSFSIPGKSNKDGEVLWIENTAVVELGRAAGAPKDKGAGIVLHKKIGDTIKKGEDLFTVFVQKEYKRQRVKNLLESLEVMHIGNKEDTFIHKITEIPPIEREFTIER